MSTTRTSQNRVMHSSWKNSHAGKKLWRRQAGPSATWIAGSITYARRLYQGSASRCNEMSHVFLSCELFRIGVFGTVANSCRRRRSERQQNAGQFGFAAAILQRFRKDLYAPFSYCLSRSACEQRHRRPQRAAATAAPSGLTIEQLIDIKHPSTPHGPPMASTSSFTWDRAGVSDALCVGPRRYGRRIEAAEQPTDARRRALAGRHASRDRALDFERRRGRTASAMSGRGGRGGRGGTSGPSELWVRTVAGGQEKRLVVAGLRHRRRRRGRRTARTSSSPSAAERSATSRRPQYSGIKIIYTITENSQGKRWSFAALARASGCRGENVSALPGGGGFGGRRWLDARHFLVERTSSDFKRRTTSVVDIETGQSKVLHEDVERSSGA